MDHQTWMIDDSSCALSSQEKENPLPIRCIGGDPRSISLPYEWGEEWRARPAWFSWAYAGR
jgi:hypothetical protein